MALFDMFLPGGGGFSIDIEPDPSIYAGEFDAMAAALHEMYPPLKASEEVFIAGVHRHFAESGPDWAPPARDYGHPLLQDTGALEGGATSEGSYAITTNQVIFHGGAMPEYGWYHQFGATRGVAAAAETRRMFESQGLELSPEFGVTEGVNVLPARPFIYTDDETAEGIFAVWEAWFDGIVGGFGAGIGGSFQVSSGGRVQTRLPSGAYGPGIH